MMAGISSASNGHETVILEKMNTCGRKIRITGKGRCNVTNAVDMSEFIKNIPDRRPVNLNRHNHAKSQ